MLISQTLSALVFLISIPGLGLLRHTTPAPPDTLPPPWKNASRLALEDHFLLPRVMPLGPRHVPRLDLQPYNEPRRARVTADADSGTVVVQSVVGDVDITPPLRIGMVSYVRELSMMNMERLWRVKSVTSVNSLGANTPAAAPTSGFKFEFPSPLPARIQSLLGPGGPALTVSGSENIVLSGASNWTNQQIGLLGQRHSLFPTLDMQQNLDIRLEGQLSDRIKVNLLQNSLNQLPLSNRIAINYRGEEDDLIQQFDLGNTSLSLPGTQYVSYSGQNEGLFGMKAASRVGPLDFTVLASKQEGRSERAQFSGGTSKQSNTILDVDYIRGVYFLLYDPNTPTRLVDETTLNVYITPPTITNDANLIRGRALVDPNGADTSAVVGNFRQLTAGADHDYEVMNNLYGVNFKVLRLKQPVDPRQCLAISYRARDVGPGGLPASAPYAVGGRDSVFGDGQTYRILQLVRPPEELLVKEPPTGQGGSAVYADTGAFNATRELELRNVYQLGGQKIDPKTFQFAIRKGTDQPYTTAFASGGVQVPYIEALGLDNFDERNGTPVFGQHDGQIDGTAVGNGSQLRVAVDFETGTLFLPDPRPFAPRLGASGKPFDRAVDALLSRRARLDGAAGTLNEPNTQIYRNYQNRGAYDAFYYMDVTFTASAVGNEIQLGSGNILTGSDVVSVNGVRWTRDRDYTIDYDLGRVSLRRAVGPADQLNIDYSYAPLFQQAGRTLLGSAFRLEGREKSAGGAFLYESRGAQDLRPRLGEEPSRSLIGDLNGDWTAHPRWLTQFVDRLPGVRTTAPSDFHLQAELGASFPNPNTRNEVYIDDMEGVRDATSLSLSPERWHWSSVPSRLVTGLPQLMNNLDHQHNGEIHWYAPPSVVHEKDLKPTLTTAQGGENPRQVLALSVPRRPNSARNDFAGGDYDSLWAGLTYALDPVGLDLSRSQFIELWVDDFNDAHDIRHPEPRVRGRHLKLHIDIGRVSEDQQRAPDEPPNGILDTEDFNRDGQLQISGDRYEDTGMDGKVDPGSPAHPNDIIETGPIRDLTTASSADPEGDTFRSTDGTFTEIDPRRYRFTNGTEGNKNLNPNPDTEDLNLNNNLETSEAYYEYTIDLGDTSAAYPYLAKGGDLQKERANGAPGYGTLPADNGWRRYRIPLADSLRTAFGIPDLTLAQHVRVWIEGIINPDPDADSLGGTDPKNFPVRPLLMLGSLEIVGSRWQVSALDSATNAQGTTVTINSVNTLDNNNIYTPPFDPGQTLNGSQSLTRREQSLALEFTRLEPRDTISAFKTFSIDEDYSRYGKLNWYAAAYQIPNYVAGVDSLYYFVRFASDEVERSYYEYRAPLPPSSSDRAIAWRQVVLKLSALSNLKLNSDFPRVDPVLYEAPGEHPGETYVIKGRPSFTRIRRVTIGLINASSNPLHVYDSGQLWFDELRATDVAKDAGHAERIQVNGKLANLLGYGLSYTGRDADFISVGETRGQGVNASQLNFNGNVDLHRFFEGTGFVLPVTYQYGRTSLKPRYTAGDDVVRTDQQSAASETRNENHSWTASIARTWGERSNPFLRFTLGGLGASITRGQSISRNPSMVDTTTTTSAAVSYGISPRGLLSLPIPGVKTRFFPLPEKFYWNYSVNTHENHTYDRLSDSTRSLVLRNSLKGRSAFVAFGGDFRPIQLLHQHFEGQRNLTLGSLNQQVGFINLGRVVNWRQSFDASYAFQNNPWFRPTLGWASSYTQNNGPELSPDLSVRSVANGQSVSMNWSVPFDRLTAPPPAADSLRRRAPPGWLKRSVARLGEIGTEATFSTSSAYTRLAGTPSLPYLVGISRAPGLKSDSTGRVRALFGNIGAENTDFRTAAHGRLMLMLGSSLSTRGEYSSHRTVQNSVERLSTESRFPDVDVDYGRIPVAMRIERVLHESHVHTGYSRSTQSEFQGSDNNLTSLATSTAWSPLIGLDGTLKNGTRAEVKLDLRSSHREDLLLGRSVTEDHNTNLSLNLTRTYTQGQKVVFLGKETTVHSTVTLGFAGSYSRRTGATRRDGYAAPIFPIGEDRLDVNGNGSYAFSSNVTGHMTLGFGQTRNLLLDIVRRNVRVEVRGQFTF